MTSFPQLTTGNISQYPLEYKHSIRTIANRLADGNSITQLDIQPVITRWQLRYDCLSDQERSGLEAFFISHEGRLRPFTFLDPAGNLIKWSEDYSKSAWDKGPGINLTAGIEGSEGINSATGITNTSAISQAIKQVIQAPGNFHYCFSFFAKSLAGQTIRTIRQCGSFTKLDTIELTTNWKRYAVSGNLQVNVPVISFGIQIEPGGQAGVFGMQVEAQVAPGSYRANQDRSAIHETTHFADDHLSFVQSGPNNNTLTIRLITAN